MSPQPCFNGNLGPSTPGAGAASSTQGGGQVSTFFQPPTWTLPRGPSDCVRNQQWDACLDGPRLPCVPRLGSPGLAGNLNPGVTRPASYSVPLGPSHISVSLAARELAAREVLAFVIDLRCPPPPTHRKNVPHKPERRRNGVSPSEYHGGSLFCVDFGPCPMDTLRLWCHIVSCLSFAIFLLWSLGGQNHYHCTTCSLCCILMTYFVYHTHHASWFNATLSSFLVRFFFGRHVTGPREPPEGLTFPKLGDQIKG